MTTIDAKGLACPQPVVLAKKAIDAGETVFAVVVDNQTAVENLTRLGENNGFQIAVTPQGALFSVGFSRDGAAAVAAPVQTAPAAEGGKWAIMTYADTLGQGDPELGASLIKMFFYTLAQEAKGPDYILFMNAGVTLPCNEEIADHLKQLSEKGTEILVCGTCLNFYGLKEELKIGTVSNMYDILQRVKESAKVVTL